MKKNDTKDYADLLRQLETKRLTKGTKSVKILVMLEMGNGGGGCVRKKGAGERSDRGKNGIKRQTREEGMKDEKRRIRE